MATKKEKAEALENMRHALTACGPDGDSTLECRWVGGGATPYGRTDYIDVRVVRPDARTTSRGPRPATAEWLSLNAATALGYRFNRTREAISLSGCGFSKTHEIADSLARLVGFALFTGEHGWVGPASAELRRAS